MNKIFFMYKKKKHNLVNPLQAYSLDTCMATIPLHQSQSVFSVKDFCVNKSHQTAILWTTATDP